jgi:hypothetical protein
MIGRLAVAVALAITSSSTAMAAADSADPTASNALASQTPVPALRDGTLGIPSVGGTGVSALLNNQIAANSGTYRADFFAQIGRLSLSDRWAIDLLGETFSAPVPTVALTPPATTPPLIELKGTTFQTLGFRVSVALSGKRLNYSQALKCITARHNLMPRPADFVDKCKAVGIDPTVESAGDESDRFALAMAKERAARGLTLVVGARFLYAGNATNAGGLAGELALQYLGLSYGWFASGAVIGLADSQDVTGPTTIETEAMKQLKLAIGGHVQFQKTAWGSEVLPRIGFYVAGGWNWWNNRFALPTTDPNIRGWVLRPFGHDPALQYVISVAPSFGTPLSK